MPRNAILLPLLVIPALATPFPIAAATAGSGHQQAASVRSLAIPVVTAPGARSVQAKLGHRRTTAFSLVGVTWRHGTGSGRARMQVRVHHTSGWSRWHDLDLESTSEGRLDGTAPMWVGRATGVAVRVTSTGRLPRGLTVALVNPGPDPVTPSRTAPAAAVRTAGLGSPAYTPLPSYVSRTEWGARPPKNCDRPRYGSHVLGVTVHHTVSSNRYSRAQSASIVRGIQAYHMHSEGWCDIGYNWLVDKYGQIFQGRSGGVLPQVRGAHAGNFDVNTFTTGISMIGNYQTARVTPALKAAMVRLVGWRLGTNFLPATGSYRLDRHRFQRIQGHRDVYLSGIRPATATACPGKFGYAWLRSGLRSRVASYISHYHSPIKAKVASMSRRTLGWLWVGEFPTYGGREARFTRGDMYSQGSLGAHWVTGRERAEFDHWHGVAGPLGFPWTDARHDTKNTAVWLQRFRHGSIYTVRTRAGRRAYGLTTGVDHAYRHHGGPNGALGAPTSRVRTRGHIDSATFAHGTITYNRATGRVTITRR